MRPQIHCQARKEDTSAQRRDQLWSESHQEVSCFEFPLGKQSLFQHPAGASVPQQLGVQMETVGYDRGCVWLQHQGASPFSSKLLVIADPFEPENLSRNEAVAVSRDKRAEATQGAP